MTIQDYINGTVTDIKAIEGSLSQGGSPVNTVPSGSPTTAAQNWFEILQGQSGQPGLLDQLLAWLQPH